MLFIYCNLIWSFCWTFYGYIEFKQINLPTQVTRLIKQFLFVNLISIRYTNGYLFNKIGTD